MAIFWLNTPQTNKDGKSVGFPFEVKECDDIFAFRDRLMSAGMVAGFQLETRDDGTRSGVKIVAERRQHGITKHGFASVSLLKWKLVEAEEKRS